MKPYAIALLLILTACKAPAPSAPSAPPAPPAPAAAGAAGTAGTAGTAAVPATGSTPPAAPAPLAPAAASWLGKWIGPEGTFLELSEEDGAYRITIQSLDGPATYDAVAVDDRIEFQRNGTLETIRATGGAETGMKWLLDKNNCLTIRTGEGFCRD